MFGYATKLTIVGLLACVAGAALAGPVTLALPGGETVMMGAQSPVPGLTLTLTEVTDQRCPSAADCYWEGTIRAVIAVQNGAGAVQMVVLCNLCDDGHRTAVAAGVTLTLDHLKPRVEVIEGLGRAAVLADYVVVVGVADLL